MSTRTGRGLRLVDEMNLGADRTTTIERRRLPARDPEEIRFEALVATIIQRDAADRRARLWERGFFMLAWIAGTTTIGLLLACLKGGL